MIRNMRERNRMNVGETIERETHVKELNEWILLLLITSGLKIGVTELCRTVRRATIELLKRILGSLEPKWKSSATSLVAFALPPNQTINVSIYFLSYL